MFGIGQHFLGDANHAAIFSGQTHRLAAGFINHHHDVLLHLPAQHPLHHFHGFCIGDAHALNEGAFFAYPFESVIDLGTTTVHHNGVQANQLEQDDIMGKAALQGFFGHGVATVFDDNGLAVETTNIRQGLGQNVCFDGRGVILRICGAH